MSKPISLTWTRSEKDCSANALVFPSVQYRPYMPLEMQLVLVFDRDFNAYSFLHRDAKLLILPDLQSEAPLCSVTVTALAHHKNQTMYTIPFRVNVTNGEPTFSVGTALTGVDAHPVDEGVAKAQPVALITFPGGGVPPHIVHSFLLVTGCDMSRCQ